jgi:hypothetical protein
VIIKILNYLAHLPLSLWRVNSGREYGNRVAFYIGMDEKLYHSALEAAGLPLHLLWLYGSKKNKIKISATAEASLTFLPTGLAALEGRFGEQRLIKEAMTAVQKLLDETQPKQESIYKNTFKGNIPECRYILIQYMNTSEKINGVPLNNRINIAEFSGNSLSEIHELAESLKTPIHFIVLIDKVTDTEIDVS